MKKVNTIQEAFAYITDCNLATVEWMRMHKSTTKHDMDRAIAIAQASVNYMVQFNVGYKNTRAQDVIQNHRGKVEDYAK